MMDDTLVYEIRPSKGVVASILFGEGRRFSVEVVSSSMSFQSGMLCLDEAWCLLKMLPKMEVLEPEGIQDLVEVVQRSNNGAARLQRLEDVMSIAQDELTMEVFSCKVLPPAQELRFMLTQVTGQQRDEFLAVLNLSIRRKRIKDPQVLDLLDQYSIIRGSANDQTVAVENAQLEHASSTVAVATAKRGGLWNRIHHR